MNYFLAPGLYIKKRRNKPSMEYIDKIVCKKYMLKGDALKERTRLRTRVEPRQEAFFLMRYYGNNFTDIGNHFGLNHATVMHGINNIVNELSYYKPRVDSISNLFCKLGECNPQLIINEIIKNKKIYVD